MFLERLTVMRKIDCELLIQLGIIDPRCDEYSAFVAWYQMLTELRVVGKRARDAEPPPPPGCHHPSHPNYEEFFGDDRVQKTVSKLTPAEKIELRDRTLAACTTRK